MRLDLLAAGSVLALQGWAYYSLLPLSLGPRVIMQPWLLTLPGYSLYEQVADQHPPLMPLLVSWFVPLAEEGWCLAAGFLAALLSLSAVLTWWAARRSGGAGAGLLALCLFACWTGQFGFEKLWHESFLAPLYALLLVMFRTSAKRSHAWLVSAGLVCGLALLVKQQAAPVAVAFVLWNAFTEWRARRTTAAALSAAGQIAAPAIAVPAFYAAVHYMRTGTLENLWFWTVQVNIEGRFASLAAMPPSLEDIARLAPAFILVPIALAQTVRAARQGDASWETNGWALALLSSSGLALYPRFAAFHLQASLPALSWLSATALHSAARGNENQRLPFPRTLRRSTLVAACALVLAVFSVAALAHTFRAVAGNVEPREIQEYSDLDTLALNVKTVTRDSGPIYVFPDDEATANLYYLLRKPPPRFWVFTYPWYMVPRVRQQIVRALEDAPPRWIVHRPNAWEIDRFAPDVVSYIRARYVVRAQIPWRGEQVQILERRASGARGTLSTGWRNQRWLTAWSVPRRARTAVSACWIAPGARRGLAGRRWQGARGL
ncbi:MAG: glycosyltransferase family 39 protein [Vicinamibacterales bacterium]